MSRPLSPEQLERQRHVATILRRYRKVAGIRQTDAADRWGVTHRAWTKYETGRRIPTARVLAQAARQPDRVDRVTAAHILRIAYPELCAAVLETFAPEAQP